MEKLSSISNFKIKNLIWLFLYIALFFITVDYIGKTYVSVANKNAINEKSDKRFEDFYALPSNTLDIAFVGSSHSYCTFDPENFDSALGTESFQLGMPLQHPDGTYYTVRELYNYQNPKLIVVEVYWDLLGRDGDIKQGITLFNSLKNQQLEEEFIKEVFSFGKRIMYEMDIINYQKDYFTYKTGKIKENLSNRYGLNDYTQQQQGEEYYKAKGYVYCDYTLLPDEYGKTNQFNGLDGRGYEISEKQKAFLKNIVTLGTEKGTAVMFVTAPVANVSLSKIKNYELINKKIKDMAAGLNVFYLDYNMPDVRKNMFTDANFRDDAHLNDSGVKLLNQDFIKYAKDFGVIEQK